jgi:RHS repeat-associated protein
MAVTKFIWDVRHDSCLMEKDGNGTTQVVYTNEPVRFARLISRRQSGETITHFFDAQQNTRQLTTSSADSLGSYSYAAFGKTHQSLFYRNPFKYKGAVGYYDDGDIENSGNYYYVPQNVYVRARSYSSQLGRWLSKDPIGFRGGDENLYRYARNSPLRYGDPTGSFVFCVGGIFGPTVVVGIPVPAFNGLPIGIGMSATCQLLACIGYPGWTCQSCITCSVTVLVPALGFYFGLTGGPAFAVFPDRNSVPEGGSISVGGGGGVNLPGLVPVSGEVTIDVDSSGGITVAIPKFGLGYGGYIAVRVSYNCTACRPLWSPGASLRGLLMDVGSCFAQTGMNVRKALQELQNLKPEDTPSELEIKGVAVPMGPTL